MHFTTIEFAVFFLIILSVNWLLRDQTKPYKLLLLSANLFFYGCLNIRFLPLLFTVALSNWLFALIIARAEKKWIKKAWLTFDLFINLGLLAFFKYFEFFFTSLEKILVFLNIHVNLPMAELIFPIGISFFTFQGVSYIIDVYRDHEKLVENPVDILLFVSFFPTIMSGPIMRAGSFIPQLYKSEYNSHDFQAAFALIISGLFKKIVIASYLSEHIVRQVFQVPDQYSSLSVLAAVYGYSIQIYCDFSGYTDMAIGLAMLLGYNIPENFRQPYRALNIQDFWRRWHISLSTWLRDYLYISLGGNRSGNKAVNLMITMVLGGLWHGAHSRFIIWGAMHGLGLVVNHAYNDLKRKLAGTPEKKSLKREAQAPLKWLKSFFNWFLTFHFVTFLWVFFRAEDTGRALEILKIVFMFNHPGDGFEFLVIPAVLTGLAIQFVGRHIYNGFISFQERLPVPLQGVTIAILCIIIMRLGPEGVLPFIYFQF